MENVQNLHSLNLFIPKQTEESMIRSTDSFGDTSMSIGFPCNWAMFTLLPNTWVDFVTQIWQPNSEHHYSLSRYGLFETISAIGAKIEPPEWQNCV